VFVSFKKVRFDVCVCRTSQHIFPGGALRVFLGRGVPRTPQNPDPIPDLKL